VGTTNIIPVIRLWPAAAVVVIPATMASTPITRRNNTVWPASGCPSDATDADQHRATDPPPPLHPPPAPEYRGAKSTTLSPPRPRTSVARPAARSLRRRSVQYSRAPQPTLRAPS